MVGHTLSHNLPQDSAERPWTLHARSYLIEVYLPPQHPQGQDGIAMPAPGNVPNTILLQHCLQRCRKNLGPRTVIC